jgi:hypothetical protein
MASFHPSSMEASSSPFWRESRLRTEIMRRSSTTECTPKSCRPVNPFCLVYVLFPTGSSFCIIAALSKSQPLQEYAETVSKHHRVSVPAPFRESQLNSTWTNNGLHGPPALPLCLPRCCRISLAALQLASRNIVNPWVLYEGIWLSYLKAQLLSTGHSRLSIKANMARCKVKGYPTMKSRLILASNHIQRHHTYNTYKIQMSGIIHPSSIHLSK